MHHSDEIIRSHPETILYFPQNIEFAYKSVNNIVIFSSMSTVTYEHARIYKLHASCCSLLTHKLKNDGVHNVKVTSHFTARLTCTLQNQPTSVLAS